MKAAVLRRFDEFPSGDEFVQYEDVADPKLERPTDVIVRFGGAGVCRTDLHIVGGIWRARAARWSENGVAALGPPSEGVSACEIIA